MAVAERELALEPLLDGGAGPDLPPGVPARGSRLPEALRARYGGDLVIPLRRDRPTVVVNFVSTLDGVTSYATPEAAGGGEISGFFEPDRFVMGLLRSLADVVLIGAGTLRAAAHERWTPEYVHPPSSAGYAALRRELGLAAEPTTAVVTSSARIDLDHPGLADPRVPVLIITSDSGAAALDGRTAGHVEVAVAGRQRGEPQRLLDVLNRRGAELVLCEGGPRLFGELLRAGLVDELFLTWAPQIAGRSPAVPRLGLVEGTSFAVSDAPWARLVDLRRAGDHLFTRYDMQGRNQ